MDKSIIPFECTCDIKINTHGSYELKISNLPHPTDENGEHVMITTGRTLGEAFFNMGHYLTISFEELFPGLLDSAPSEVLSYEHVK